MIGTATELLKPEDARTPAWYQARRAGITASEISVILGLNKWDSPLALYFRKCGELGEDDDNYRMALGRELEPYVLRCFTEMTELETEPCGLIASLERPWQLATPDAVIGNVPVEGKTAVSEDEWGPAGSSEIPLSYRCQLLWQMDVLGADHGYMCVIFMRSGEPRWYQIGWDGDDIGVMREAGLDFLRRIEEGDAPAADAADATRKALKDRFPGNADAPDARCGVTMLRAYKAALRADKRAAQRKALAENRIREIMGPAVRLRGPDGEIVATRRIYQRSAYEVKATTVDALYPAKGLTDGA